MHDTQPPTEAELLLLELQFPGQQHLGIFGVQHTQFSIARYYGGISWNGHHYTYLPHVDQLWRQDVLRALIKLRKQAKAQAKAQAAAQAASAQTHLLP